MASDPLSDFIDEHLGKNVKGETAVDALASITDAVSKMEFSTEEATKTAKNFESSLALLKQQVEKNIKATKRELSNDRITSKQATAMIKRQLSAVDDLNKVIKNETDNREVGVKQLGQFNTKMEAVNSELVKEKKILKSRAKGEKRYMLELRQMVKHSTRAHMKQAASSLGRAAERLGTGVVGAAGLGKLSSKLAEKGSTLGGKAGKRTMMAGGALGIAGIATALFAKAAGAQKKGLNAAAPRMFNYGQEGKGRTIESTIQVTQKALTDTRHAARALGQDADTASAAITRIAKETGARFGKLGKSAHGILQLSQIGLGGVDEIAGDLIERMNTVGMSGSQAALEVKRIALQARHLNKITKGNGIQMEDLYKATKQVASATGALVTDNEDIAETMAVMVAQGSKLEKSYNRRARAAQGLTTALSANYDMGFATLEVQDELSAAANSDNKTLAKEARIIQQDLASGRIHAMQAAKDLKAIGGTTDKGVADERLRKSALDLVNGNRSMAEARLGELDFDQAQLLGELGRRLKSGEDLNTARAGLAAKGRDTGSLNALSRKVGSRQRGAKEVAAATLDELMLSLSGVFTSALKSIAITLEQINKGVQWVTRSDFFGKSEADIKKDKKEAEQDNRKGTIAMMIASSRGETQSWTESDSSMIKDLAGDKNLQQKFAMEFKRGFSKADTAAIATVIGAKKAAALDASVTGYAQEFKTNSTSRMQADGSIVVKVTGEAIQTGAAQQAGRQRNVQAAARRSNSKQGSAGQ